MKRESELIELRREVKKQRAWLGKLAFALYTHTRTDLAPDAAIGIMKKLVNEITPKKKRRKS